MWSAQAQVEQLLEERVPLAHIEAYIDHRHDISEDDRNALWLYLWAKSKTSSGASVLPAMTPERRVQARVPASSFCGRSRPRPLDGVARAPLGPNKLHPVPPDRPSA